MSADPFHLNRPVHLALRDVFFEKAVACIKTLPAHKLPAEQRKTAEQALYLLREARHQADAANLSDKTSTQSRLFMDFMDTVTDDTLAITRMLRRQIAVDTADNPLDRFLSSADTGAKMSGHFRRCAAHILKGLMNILQLAEKPCRDLQRTSLAKMTVADKVRYEKAYKHFEKLADREADKAVEEIITTVRTSGSIR
jgi:hypothetical protein